MPSLIVPSLLAALLAHRIGSLPEAATPGFVQILPGAVERVVAAGEHVALLRKGAVLVLREDGTPIFHMEAPDSIPAGRSEQDPRHGAEHMLDLLDVAEIDRDTDFSDELLEKERTLAERSAAKGPKRVPPREAWSAGLAANDTDIWIARGDLVHVARDGSVTRAWLRDGFHGPLAVAAQVLLAPHDKDVVLVDLPSRARQKIDLPPCTRHLALSPSASRRAWSTDEVVAWSGPESVQTLAARPVVDLVYCEERLVAILPDALVVVPPDEKPHIRAHPPGARRLLCAGNAGMPWLLAGNELHASVDEGRHWKPLAQPVPAPLLDLAASRHRLWLATEQGLYASTDAAVPSPAPPAPAHGKAQHQRRPSASLLSWLPKVSVRAGATMAPNGRQWETLAFAAFPFEARRLPVLGTASDEWLGQGETPPAQPEDHPGDQRDSRNVPDPNDECLRVSRRKAVELGMAEPERARSYVARAAYAAWLPELRVLISRRYGRSESVDVDSSSTALSSPLGINTVNDVRYEARATWDLSKLVFSSEELAAQTQAMHMAELRRDIEAMVNRLYFERRALARVDASAAGRRSVRASEIEAELDALTAGSFGACMSRKATDR